jgi:hypothetical protein
MYSIVLKKQVQKKLALMSGHVRKGRKKEENLLSTSLRVPVRIDTRLCGYWFDGSILRENAKNRADSMQVDNFA